MSQPDFDILKLIELGRYKKYETTVAGFSVLDKIDKIDIPKKLRTRKFAVQALHALSENLVQFSYFTPEQKLELAAEAAKSDAPYKGFKGLFANTAAPVVEEETEEEFIPQEEEKTHDFVDEDAESFGAEAADADEEEEDEDEEEDDSNLDEDEEEEK